MMFKEAYLIIISLFKRNSSTIATNKMEYFIKNDDAKLSTFILFSSIVILFAVFSAIDYSAKYKSENLAHKYVEQACDEWFTIPYSKKINWHEKIFHFENKIKEKLLSIGNVKGNSIKINLTPLIFHDAKISISAIINSNLLSYINEDLITLEINTTCQSFDIIAKSTQQHYKEDFSSFSPVNELSTLKILSKQPLNFENIGSISWHSQDSNPLYNNNPNNPSKSFIELFNSDSLLTAFKLNNKDKLYINIDYSLYDDFDLSAQIKTKNQNTTYIQKNSNKTPILSVNLRGRSSNTSYINKKINLRKLAISKNNLSNKKSLHYLFLKTSNIIISEDLELIIRADNITHNSIIINAVNVGIKKYN